MKALNKYVFQPIGNLFTRPKSVWGKSGNIISDWITPIGLGMVPGVGPALAAGYGAARGYTQQQQVAEAYNRDRPIGSGEARMANAGWADALWGGVGGLAKGFAGSALASGYGSMASGGQTLYGGGAPVAGSVAPAGSGLTGAGMGAANTAGATTFASTAPANLLAAGVSQGMGVGGMGIGGNTTTGKVAGVAGGAGGVGTGGLNFGTAASALAAGASLMTPAPDVKYSTTGEKLSTARNIVLSKYLGSEAAAQLPSTMANEYLDMITKPIGELYPVEKDARWGRVEQSINQSYDDYEKSITHNFAQAGGIGSSDYQKAMGEAKRMRAQELSQSRQEIEQSLFNTQIQMKQQALTNAGQQGQFDERLAFELAGMIGEEDTLRASIETSDYDTFQRVMGMIMAMGQGVA